MKDENVLLGPPTVVTIMPTAPGLLLAGIIQVIMELLTTIILVAFNSPNVTVVAPVKAVPLIVTVVPPFVLPDNGKMPVILAGII